MVHYGAVVREPNGKGRLCRFSVRKFIKCAGIMKLHLKVAVYRGGTFWKECWESIKQNLDLFEGVYVSFNLSELQDEDVAVIGDLQSEKIHWIRQKRFLSAAQHGVAMDHWLRQFRLDGHVLIFCHDDILIREGLLELHAMNLQESDAAFCAAVVFFEKKEGRRSLVARELAWQSRAPMSPEVFLTTRDQLLLSVSRVVIPAAAFRNDPAVWNLPEYGCWAEFCYLCAPEVSRIFQTAAPAVGVRWHENSETSRTPRSLRVFDTILFQLYMFSRSKDPCLRLRAAKDAGYAMRLDFPRSLLYFVQAQFRLRKLDSWRPADGVLMAGYFIRIVGEKIMKRLGKGARP